MRRLGPLRLSVFLLLIAAAYMVWPLYTVLTIREAMRSGDTATLAAKVEWDRVRGTGCSLLVVLFSRGGRLSRELATRSFGVAI